MARRMTGSGAMNFSYRQNAARPVAPMRSGTRVRQCDHGYMTPPQVSGIRNDVMDPMKRMEPIQSTRRSFDAIDEGRKLSFKKRGTMM